MNWRCKCGHLNLVHPHVCRECGDMRPENCPECGNDKLEIPHPTYDRDRHCTSCGAAFSSAYDFGTVG